MFAHHSVNERPEEIGHAPRSRVQPFADEIRELR